MEETEKLNDKFWKPKKFVFLINVVSDAMHYTTHTLQFQLQMALCFNPSKGKAFHRALWVSVIQQGVSHQ